MVVINTEGVELDSVVYIKGKTMAGFMEVGLLLEKETPYRELL